VYGPHVRGWNVDGGTVSPLPGFSYIAWAGALYGANVSAGADVDLDGRDEIVAGPGPDPAMESPVNVYIYSGSAISLWVSLDAYKSDLTHGVKVAGGRFSSGASLNCAQSCTGD